MKKKILLIGVTVLVVFLLSAADAAVWYVHPDSVLNSIQAGIDSATTADTILVACGTYYEHDVMMKPGVCLRSETGQAECVTIDADSLGRVIVVPYTPEDSAVTIEGFTITGGLATGAAMPENCGGGLFSQFSWGTINNCTFSGNSAERYGGGIYYGGSPSITNCTFSGNSADYGGGGVACWSSIYEEKPVIIDSCVFLRNWAGSGGGGMFCTEAWVAITNCTFCGNAAPFGGGIQTEDYDFYPLVTLSNTIVAFSTQEEALYKGLRTEVELTCCDLYGNAGGDWVSYIANQYGINGNISQNPLFCDSDKGDFHIPDLSPCVIGPCGQIGAFGLGCLDPRRPEVLSIIDVGNDQGRRVRVRWHRSSHDARGDTVDITGYGIYRRQDQYLKLSGARAQIGLGNSAGEGGLRPDGWDYLGTVPAHEDSIYQFVAPTLCDSTAERWICWSVFFIRATTPDPFMYFDSHPDSGYSADNLAPSTPEGLMAASGDTSINLIWNAIPDEDFRYYTIYKGTESGFTSDASKLLGATIETAYSDIQVLSDSTYYYRVSAYDFAGNESQYSG